MTCKIKQGGIVVSSMDKMQSFFAEAFGFNVTFTGWEKVFL